MARKSRACAEAYIGTASRSVEILAVPPPKAAANLAGGSTAPPERKRTLSGRKLATPALNRAKGSILYPCKDAYVNR